MNILVPANGSWASYQAEKYAIELCKKWGGKVIAIHIYRRDPKKWSWWRNLNQEIFRTVYTEKDAHAIIEGVKKLGDEAGVEMETEVRESSRSPSDEIIQYVKERGDIDLIVIGPRPKRRVLNLLFGSTTFGLIREFGRQIKVPVVQVPETE